MSKHTPAHWAVSPSNVLDVISSSGEVIAEVQNWSIPNEQAIANAQLIASAPEMYEALKEITDAFDYRACQIGDAQALQLGLQAIAKAEGRES